MEYNKRIMRYFTVFLYRGRIKGKISYKWKNSIKVPEEAIVLEIFRSPKLENNDFGGYIELRNFLNKSKRMAA